MKKILLVLSSILVVGCSSFIEHVEQQEKAELAIFKEAIKEKKLMELCFEHDRQMEKSDRALNQAKVVAISEELKARGQDPFGCRQSQSQKNL